MSIRRQCALLGISRSSVYYAPRGESAENLALMRRIGKFPHPLVETTMRREPVGAVGRRSAACPSRCGRVSASTATAAVHGPPIAHVPAVVGLTTPDVSLSFNRYESSRTLIVIASSHRMGGDYWVTGDNLVGSLGEGTEDNCLGGDCDGRLLRGGSWRDVAE